jgi:hypothetical protein
MFPPKPAFAGEKWTKYYEKSPRKRAFSLQANQL